MSDGLEDRRKGYTELAESYHSLLKGYDKILAAIHSHDTEIAVFRAQLQADSGRISLLEKAVEKIFERLDEMRALITNTRDTVIEILDNHVKQENNDRIKLMNGVIATLISVIGFGGAAIWQLVSR